MNLTQVKYVTAGTPAELETAVNLCLAQDNRWKLEGGVNVFDKPDVAEPVVWVQTLLRYVDEKELNKDTRAELE